MAYGLLLLRSTPMVLSAAAVSFDYSQYLFLTPFLNLSKVKSQPGQTAIDREQANAILTPYIHHEFPTGLTAILVLYPLAWLSTGANLALATPAGRLASASSSLSLLPLSRAARTLYTAGLIFSVGHMLWGPRAKNLMEQIGRLGRFAAGDGVRQVKDGVAGEVEEDGDNLTLLEKWMKLHITRTFAADIPGWICFTAAFLLSQRV